MSRSMTPWFGLAATLLVSGRSFALPTWWFQDPNYPGDRASGCFSGVSGQPSYCWYDDDVGTGAGSVVRLPEDARYMGDVLTCVACYGGGSQTMHSPYFIGADGKVFFFNHMDPIYLSGTGWYNGGAVIGLTGGGTCKTGYGTFCGSSNPCSTGPHFCIESNTHPDVDFPPNYTPTSSCSHSDGTSGAANILCTSGHPQCAPYDYQGHYLWNCQADGNLHSCDASGNLIVTNCQGAGCKINPIGTNDVCNTACAPYAYQGHYLWNCQADGNLHSCDASGNLVTQNCGGSGCTTKPTGTNDVCNAPCAPYTYHGQYLWNCQSDGNLHSCDASNTPVATSCNGAGCKVEAVGTNDICNPTAACKPYACGSSYAWTCEADGDLHSCDSSGQPVVTHCNGAGCSPNGSCTNDACNVEDAGRDGGPVEADAGSHADAGAHPDAGAGADGSTEAEQPDAGEPPAHRGGCGAAGGGGALGLALLALVATAARRKR